MADIDKKQGNKEHEKTYAATGEKLELRKKMGTMSYKSKQER